MSPARVQSRVRQCRGSEGSSERCRSDDGRLHSDEGKQPSGRTGSGTTVSRNCRLRSALFKNGAGTAHAPCSLPDVATPGRAFATPRRAPASGESKASLVMQLLLAQGDGCLCSLQFRSRICNGFAGVVASEGGKLFLTSHCATMFIGKAEPCRHAESPGGRL